MTKINEIHTLIEELVTALDTHKLHEIEAAFGTISVRIRKDAPSVQSIPTAVSASTQLPATKDVPILSPTVGTFYARPSPNDPPFTALKQHVTKNQTVGLIESMKVFYPIQAPCSGIIDSILIEHGNSVEFQQNLMAIIPDAS